MAAQGAAAIYSIGAVARMLDLSVQTFRAWEDRYGQVVPARSSGGRRLYSRDQVISPASSANRSSAVCSHPTPTACLPSALATSRKRELRRDLGRRPIVNKGDPPSCSLSVIHAAEFADYFLRTEGYAVHVGLSAAEAERVLDAQPLNVAVVDLMISGGAGLDLCRTIRARASTPILAVSAVDSRDEALDAGVTRSCTSRWNRCGSSPRCAI